MAVELNPEPEGGTELKSLSTMANSRMKNMGIVSSDDLSNSENEAADGDVYEFWMTAEAEGALIKDYRVKVSKDAAKSANFPGFRKGQVPPWAQPQLTTFAIQETIIKTCEAAVDAYGLIALKGSDGSVEVHEDVSDMTKGYNLKAYDNIQFTATFKAMMDPQKMSSEEEEEEEENDESEGDVVDVEVTAVAEE